MKPEEPARIFVAAARISAPVALLSICTHVVTLRGSDSPRGFIATVPKSTTNQTRFFPATGRTLLHSVKKFGARRGAMALMESLLKV